MLMPSVYDRDLWDDFFEPTRCPRRGYDSFSGMMDVDIKDKDTEYEIIMNLPGIKKENVKVQLKDEYLTVFASSYTNSNADNAKEDNDGKYIRRERYVGSFSRSFYMGKNMKQEDVKAKFEDGTLVLTIPKEGLQPAVEENCYIEIE